MAKSRDEMAAILIADHERFMARLEAEVEASKQGKTTVDPYHYSRGITGEPSDRNRVVRVAPNSWLYHNYTDAKGNLRNRKTRCVGGDVLVTHASGKTELRSARSFRKESIHTQQRTHAKTVAEARHTITCADLAPIGNID